MCGVSGFWGPRDRVLLEAMSILQVNWLQKQTIFWGVRAFGGIKAYKGGL